ncbi:MAG: hypothetical protein Q9227_003551 [Pyrenula ochraceoflavens]
MPEKPATVAAYAAGASLAAITLFYVFGPTFFIDGDKKQVVGLYNPANDCFINSVLQVLAGLGELRLYLIRELHRRRLDGPQIYSTLPDPQELRKGDRPEEILNLQQGLVTKALKEMLDALNERPIYRKTISARGFIQALEKSLRRGVSRNQQDAQEFLQHVAERLSDEYHAGAKARRRAGLDFDDGEKDENEHSAQQNGITVQVEDTTTSSGLAEPASLLPPVYSFPLEGKLESRIECQHCHHQNKPSSSPFVTITLNVPQKSSTTLGSCFDGLFKTEYIDDFKCDKCRLEHAVEYKRSQMKAVGTEKARQRLEKDITLIQKALQDDPETPPKGVDLPDSNLAPKRKIARHMRMTSFPKVAAIHLSRSINDGGRDSIKNAAKVSFSERLRLGGILDGKWYKLLGIVCHKGSHNSGHYETFRRNHQYAPFATPDVFSSYATYSRNASAVPSPSPSPDIRPMSKSPEPSSSVASSPDLSTLSVSSTVPSTPPSHISMNEFQESKTSSRGPTSAPRSSLSVLSSQTSPHRRSGQSDVSTPTSMFRAMTPSMKSSASTPHGTGNETLSKLRRKKKSQDKWWRISDDKIKECKTGDVLGMQKEVYLLFYELEKEEVG